MSKFNTNLTADLDTIFENLSKEDRVRQYQKIKAAQAYLDLKMKALKTKVLEQQDERFEIVTGSTRTTARARLATSSCTVRLRGRRTARPRPSPRSFEASSKRQAGLRPRRLSAGQCRR